MRFRNTLKLTMTIALALAATGCGHRTIAAAPIDASPAATAATAPTGATTPANAATNAQFPAATNMAAYSNPAPAVPAPTLADLTATVTSQKNGSFLGMGKFKCTVQVANPSSVSRHGTLTVTFMNGSKPSATAPVVKDITLAAGASQSFDLEDTKWSTNGVRAEVVTQPYQAAPVAANAMMTGMPQMSMPTTMPY